MSPTTKVFPLTSPVRTLIDQATRLRPMQLERAVNEADKLDRVRADVLHASLDDYRGQPGVKPLRKLLDPLAFRLSDSKLEQLMRPLARAVGLSDAGNENMGQRLRSRLLLAGARNRR